MADRIERKVENRLETVPESDADSKETLSVKGAESAESPLEVGDKYTESNSPTVVTALIRPVKFVEKQDVVEVSPESEIGIEQHKSSQILENADTLFKEVRDGLSGYESLPEGGGQTMGQAIKRLETDWNALVAENKEYRGNSPSIEASKRSTEELASSYQSLSAQLRRLDLVGKYRRAEKDGDEKAVETIKASLLGKLSEVGLHQYNDLLSQIKSQVDGASKKYRDIWSEEGARGDRAIAKWSGELLLEANTRGNFYSQESDGISNRSHIYVQISARRGLKGGSNIEERLELTHQTQEAIRNEVRGVTSLEEVPTIIPKRG